MKNKCLGLWLLLIGVIHAYDFSHCQKYYQLASHSNSVSLFWQRGQVSFLHSLTPPKGVRILKKDPFIGFYLVQAPYTKFAYHLLDISPEAFKYPMASVSKAYARVGTITKRQERFLGHARFSTPIAPNGVVGNICYQIYGVGFKSKDPHAFIESKYIKRFLSQNAPYYGDIGVRVRSHGALVVELVDPFFKNNPFLEGDVITHINNQAIPNSARFEWVVSNLAYQSEARVTIKRRGVPQILHVRVDKRHGGFLLPDTFLERFGVVLDSDLVITARATRLPAPLNTLKVGDQLVWINHKPIAPKRASHAHKLHALQEALSHAHMQGRIELLLLRRGLEFYIRL
ncbi:PDZ domain-containing protein [Helicobacter bizzozeronii]|uniref:DUF7488 domain-containing protein n=1 Tax=Helicobacter bizzozeronii TaxID=56877 RepID=UPI00244D8AFE|nr:PDZ domain-containing protein [Helicobacter bizzozeronii]GMB93275.1 PDZ domain-containing protein [Helicobacter bizzozeronii]